MTFAWNKRLLLGPDDVPATLPDWEVIGVFNPAAAELRGRTILVVRVAERPREQRAGYVALPRWTVGVGPTVDWVAAAEVQRLDRRLVLVKSSGLARLTSVSHLRVVPLDDRSRPTAPSARFEPQSPLEEFGVEDARVTRIGDRYWMTYVAVSPHGVATALASTADFARFERHGIIFSPENKDVVIFPEKVAGAYRALHRPSGTTPLSRPAIWLGCSGDLIHWGSHAPLYAGRWDWEGERVGAGVPPLRVADGWLAIYHGCRPAQRAGQVGRYAAAAMLLDADRPTRILRHSQTPILAPTEPFENSGFVPQVVFPTGMVARDETLAIFFGAADSHVAVAEAPLRRVLDSLRSWS